MTGVASQAVDTRSPMDRIAADQRALVRLQGRLEAAPSAAGTASPAAEVEHLRLRVTALELEVQILHQERRLVATVGGPVGRVWTTLHELSGRVRHLELKNRHLRRHRRAVWLFADAVRALALNAGASDAVLADAARAVLASFDAHERKLLRAPVPDDEEDDS